MLLLVTYEALQAECDEKSANNDLLQAGKRS